MSKEIGLGLLAIGLLTACLGIWTMAVAGGTSHFIPVILCTCVGILTAICGIVTYGERA